MDALNSNIDLQRPVKLAEDVYWVGFYDEEEGIQCNPYLIIDEDEGVLIDGGSRPDFPTVMMKILQTGIAPGMISTLIYQHYDPDLCGSLPNLEDIINRPTLKILSHSYNNFFIRHYMARSKLYCIDQI
ncbi:MAG: MBL fold metallo-hydrolase, partial [Nitrospinae bacterium]|nr:MBL fold metallo-hydrolase [Nitrospinota bacterium]